MEKKFSNLDELIHFIDTAPIEEVNQLLESFGFGFIEKRKYNPIFKTTYDKSDSLKEIKVEDIQYKNLLSKATYSKLLNKDTSHSYNVSKKLYKEVSDVTFTGDTWEVAS